MTCMTCAYSPRLLIYMANIRLAKLRPHVQSTTEFYPIEGAELDLNQHFCKAAGIGYVRMWSGCEPCPRMEEAQDCVQDADIFVVIGTSLQVYPVAGLIHEIPANCQADYIDPKATAAAFACTIFRQIAQSATDGMQTLLGLLKSAN